MCYEMTISPQMWSLAIGQNRRRFLLISHPHPRKDQRRGSYHMVHQQSRCRPWCRWLVTPFDNWYQISFRAGRQVRPGWDAIAQRLVRIAILLQDLFLWLTLSCLPNSGCTLTSLQLLLPSHYSLAIATASEHASSVLVTCCLRFLIPPSHP